MLQTLKIDTVETSQPANTITLTGKVLFNDDKGLQAIARADKDLEKAENNLRVAGMNLVKTKRLHAGDSAFRIDSSKAEMAVRLAKIDYGRICRVLRIAGGNTPGPYHQPVVSDRKTAWIRADAFGSDSSLIHLGDMVDITTLIYPGRLFRGKIDKIQPIAYSADKAMKVLISLLDPDYALKPEMSVSIMVTDKESRSCLSLPARALIFDHDHYYALVYKSRTDIRITPLQVINTLHDSAFIAAGVTKGEKVIGSQVIFLYDALNH